MKQCFRLGREDKFASTHASRIDRHEHRVFLLLSMLLPSLLMI